CLAGWRKQMKQYFETDALRVLDLHVFEDKDAQLQWIKLRGASAAHDRFLSSSATGAAAGVEGSRVEDHRQVVLFRCGHGYHHLCLAERGDKSLHPTTTGGKGESKHRMPLLECLRCAGVDHDHDEQHSPQRTDVQQQSVVVQLRG
ncbi:hypothetical protein H4S06_004871, partial [Coemansia sp. BCRC 34490]